MNLRKQTALLAGKTRLEIETYWRAYFENNPKREPQFIKTPLIAEPYGANPSDWYEPHEIQEALDAGYEWDKENGCWRLGDELIDEDDYSEESEP